jgi:exopolysaccharide biosynthesis protein
VKRSGQKTTANKIQVVLDRIFGFILATVILIGIAGLGIEYVLVKGPSTALRNTFLATMIETRRFDCLANIYLTDEEYVELIEDIYRVDESATDSSLIKTEVEVSVNEQGQNVDAYGIVDEDGDGIVLQDVTGEGFTGYMLIVYDPMRIRLGIPDIFGGTGLTVEQYCEKYNALAAVNASGFDDPNGTAWGGVPVGVII